MLNHAVESTNPAHDLERRANAAITAVLDEIFEDEEHEIRGEEFVVRNPRRKDNNLGSFSVHIGPGDKRFVWKDFAVEGVGGRGAIALINYLRELDEQAAMRVLTDILDRLPIQETARPVLQLVGSGGEKWIAVCPVPADAPLPPDRHHEFGAPTARWDYRDGSGNLLMIKLRFDRPEATGEKSKVFRPLSYRRHADTGEYQWRWLDLPERRPLYGLNGLALRPNAPVVVAEGEKSADAAGRLMPGYVATTSPNGAGNAKRADWSPLKGRDVTIWPDADATGEKYAAEAKEQLHAIGAASVRVFDLRPFRQIPLPGGDFEARDEALHDGWDAADAEREGWTPAHIERVLEQMPDPERENEVQAFLSRIRREYAFIVHGGGGVRKPLYLHEYHDPALGSDGFFFVTKSTLLEQYPQPKEWVRQGGGSRELPVIRRFIDGEGRREYPLGVTFFPGKTPTGFFNLFKGWPVQPVAGDCSLYWSHIRDVICAGNETLYRFVRKWLAHMMQKPTKLPETALVLRGEQGTGKGRFVKWIGELVAPHFIAVHQAEHLLGKFNGHQANKLLVFADEALWGGDKRQEGALKALVTEAQVNIEAKGVDVIRMPSYRRFIFASNNDWVVARDHDDRRFLVLDVADSQKENEDYFKAIDTQMQGGGLEALLHDLQREDLTGFNPRKLPRTSNGYDMKLAGDPFADWLHELLDCGDWASAPAEGPSSELFAPDIAWSRQPFLMPTNTLYRHYEGWFKNRGRSHVDGDRVFGAKVKKVFGDIKGREKARGSRPYFYRLPGLVEARKRLEDYLRADAEIWTAPLD